MSRFFQGKKTAGGARGAVMLRDFLSYAAGGPLPGVPAVTLGHNDQIAWGLTNTAPDVQDLFIEQINPSIESAARMCGANMLRLFTRMG